MTTTLPVPRIRPLRVCFLIDRLDAAGTESQLLALIQELDRRRVRSFLALLDGTDERSQALEPKGCPVLRLGIRSLRRPSTAVRLARLAGWLIRHRIDVIQTHFLDSTYVGIPLAKLLGLRAVRVRNNLGYWMNPVHRGLGRIIGRLADVTVTNCEPARHAILSSERSPGSKVVVLENGVDLERFRANRPPDVTGATVRIGMTANLRPVKRVDLLIRSAAAVCRAFPRVEFQIAGEGPQRSDLDALIREMRLGGRVRLLGGVSDVPAFLGRLDIAVLCSDSEAMSNALLEYLAAGRPVVATAVGGNVGLIHDGITGLLVPPGDEPALTAAITRLLTEPGLAVQLGAAARRATEERFGREAVRRRFEVFYDRLCRG